MSVLISALRQTAPERITVCLDSGEEIPATLGVVTEYRLFSGKTLDEAELRALRAASALSLCKNRGLALLSYRPMSAKELLDKLIRKGEEPACAEEAVRWLLARGYLDEVRYAGMVVRHYAGKGYGPGRIRQELQRRGVPRELWDEAMEELPEQDDTLDAFLAARLKNPGDRAQVQKVSAALIRRGFSWEEIRAALARLRAEIAED
jgi:regulatory protein